MIDFIKNAANNKNYISVSQITETMHYIDPSGQLLACRPEDFVPPLRLDIPPNIFDFNQDIDLAQLIQDTEFLM